MTHDPATDGNLFAWVLAHAQRQREEALARAGRQREANLAAARKFHELPAAGRTPIVLASTPERIA